MNNDETLSPKTQKVYLSRFNPQRDDPQVLETIFVQRHDLAKNIVEKIHDSATSGNKHHFLIIGPRGSGKTHFVSLVFHRINNMEELMDRLRIAWLEEDETTTSFLDLLLRIYRALEKRYSDEFPQESLEPLFDLKQEQATKELKRLLLEQLKDRTLLIIVENLGELFRRGLKDAGQKELRALIQEHPVFTILATTQQLFDEVSDRKLPFFGFFQNEYLKELTLDDAVLLLRKIAEFNHDAELVKLLDSPKGRARVRALHHLSGGNHRVYIVLSEFIDATSLDELVRPFEKMLDELTPYYQSRISQLSPQQSKIVEYLCAVDKPVPVKEIARRLFLSHQTTASVLGDLRDRRYVRKHSRGRESLYELTEPLMRLCVEVKENTGQPMRLIVDFLRIWYGRDKLEERFKLWSSPKEREYLRLALDRTKVDNDLRVRWIQEDLEKYREGGDVHAECKALEELATTRGTSEDWFNLGLCRFKLNQYEEALEVFKKTTQLYPNQIQGWNGLGFALAFLEQHRESLEAFDRAISLNARDDYAWEGRSLALWHLQRYEEALACETQRLKLNPGNAESWNSRGAMLQHIQCYEEALKAYQEALKLNPEHPYARYNQAELFLVLELWEEGFTTLQQALSKSHSEKRTEAGDVESIITIIFDSTRDKNTWQERVQRLVQIYANAEALSYLGNGLIRSLPKTDVTKLSEQAIGDWQDIWEQVSIKHDEMQLPVRIFKVGLRYLQTEDKLVLYDLVQEEREILKQALDIDLDDAK
ncbi:MAG: tetratricopeptide repeat protein [Gemmataceae bacterium]